jgi:hypothetical protein
MSRWKAASLHLGISVFISTIVAAIIYLLWYPPPYFKITGGSTLMLLIMLVDVVLGPLMTLIVFRSGKKGLKLDLTIIGALQLAAFCYGATVIFAARPVFVVAVVDRLAVVAANQIEEEDLAKAPARFRDLSWSGPRLVGVVPPKDKTAELASSALAGRDIEKMPEYFVDYEDAAETLFKHAKPLAVLAQKFPQDAGEIARLVRDHGGRMEDLFFVPLQGRTASATSVISASTRQPIGTLPIDPW